MSRETRLLLTTAFVAVAALWGLARVRFPEQPPPPNPVQPILTQLAARPAFEDLAASIAALRPRLEPRVLTTAGTRAALRIRPDVAALLTDISAPLPSELRDQVIALDPASGLATLRVEPVDAPPLATWTADEPRQPRYFVASDVSTRSLALSPVFVAALAPTGSPVWPGEIWLLPARTDLAPGTFVFTGDARLAGLVVDHGSRRAIVPGGMLLSEVDRLLTPRVSTPGYVGIEVQQLTPALARATGGASGLIVSWVDPMGPAAQAVTAGDVLEAADDQPLATMLEWNARVARLTSGERMRLRVRQSSQTREVVIDAAPLRARQAAPSLGLALEALPRTGAIVQRTDPGSAAEQAGIRPGDVITRIGDVRAPGPAGVRRAFAAAASGDALLVAFTRGGSHHVTALEKP